MRQKNALTRINKSLVFLVSVTVLAGCANGNSTDVGDGMTFAWQNSLGYTNIYRGDGTEPVIPGGCDSAKWNDRYVLTKGEYWRYANNNAWHLSHVPADSLFYFVVDKKLYDGHQELDPALHGPLTLQEQAEWERRIPGPYRVPE